MLTRKCTHIDAAIQQYESMSTMRRPVESTTTNSSVLHRQRVSRRKLSVLGRDLADVAHFVSVFDKSSQDDLVFLGEDNAEDDFFSQLVVGPEMQLFHWVWKRFKVWKSELPYLLVSIADACS